MSHRTGEFTMHIAEHRQPRGVVIRVLKPICVRAEMFDELSKRVEDRGFIERLLRWEMLVDKGFVDAGFLGDVAGAGTRRAQAREYVACGLDDLEPALRSG
jgi:hypothetical protein